MKKLINILMKQLNNTTKENILKEYGSKDNVKYDVEIHKAFDKLTEYNEVK